MEKSKIAAIVKAGGKQYSADICSKMKAIKRAGGNVTSADLIQAMMESFLESLERQIRIRMTAVMTK